MNFSNHLQWVSIPLKFLFTDQTTGSWGVEPDTDTGIICIRAADFITNELRHSKNNLTRREYELNEIKERQLQTGDLIIEKSGGGENQPVGRVVSFELNEIALCSNFLERLRPNHSILYSRFGAYLLYYLWSNRVVVKFIKQTTGIQNLDSKDYFSQVVDIPPLSEQKAIAHYLDQETATIDELIKIKKRLLELLDEKRRALITHAVTRGLNPDVLMRDSGVEWIGEVPKHWGVEFAKWLFKQIDDRSITGQEELLTVSHITGVTPRSEKDVNMFMAESMEGYKVCQSGDLVINTLWAWMGAMGVSFKPGIVSPSYHVYRPMGKYHPVYLDYLVRIPIFAEEAIRYSKGVWISRLRLYPEEFFQILLPVPLFEEQEEIAKYLVEETQKLDNLGIATKKTIDLLQERRTALITAAVTGQLKIKE